LPGAYHWLLLVHVNFCGNPFLDLLSSHPPLALALALRRKLVPWRVDLEPPSAAADLAGARRRRIAALLEFPGAERIVRLLARIPLAALSEETFRRIRRALADPEVSERLAYLPAVNALAASILADGRLRPLVAPACLAAVSQWTDPDASERFLRLLSATARLAAALGRPPAAIAEPPQLEVAYRRLLHRAAPELARSADPDLFALPPVAETETIHAIRHPRELQAEGREMHHCAGGYAARVRSGDAYFYRMTEPERVTICLRPGRRGWELEEARGICNRRIQSATLEVIHRWLGIPPVTPPPPASSAPPRVPVFVAPPVVPPPPFGHRPERPRHRRRRPDPRQMVLDLALSL
jgi:hypothetical protein